MTQQINLFDPNLQRQRDWLALGNVVAAGVLMVVAVGVLGSWIRQEVPSLTAQIAASATQVQSLRDQMTALGQQVANRKPNPQVEQEIGAARLMLEARSEVVAVMKQRLGPDSAAFADYLRGFARQSVNGLWLTGFALDSASGGMEIQGRTLDPALLPEYIRRLNQEAVFQGRAFAALKLVEGKPLALPDAASTSPATPATPVVTSRAPWHEFMLIPVKGSDADKLAPAVLTQALKAGGPG